MKRYLIVMVFGVSMLLPALAAWSHPVGKPPVDQGPKVCSARGMGPCNECDCPKYIGQSKAGAFCQRESCMHACELHFASALPPGNPE
jgi:hypothetical protein